MLNIEFPVLGSAKTWCNNDIALVSLQVRSATEMSVKRGDTVLPNIPAAFMEMVIKRHSLKLLQKCMCACMYGYTETKVKTESALRRESSFML